MALSGPAVAQSRADVWELAFGTLATEIDQSFTAYACGTVGGPPSLRLTGFADFVSCPAEANGLHEVYFRYDEGLENIARALERPRDVRRHGGTTAFDFPVVVSFLFDAEGALRGKRIVTDPRPENATERGRAEFWTLGNLMQQELGDGWSCADLPTTARVHAVGSYLIHRRCEFATADVRYAVEQDYLQEAGQSFLNPHTARIEPDNFSSETRFEAFDARTP